MTEKNSSHFRQDVWNYRLMDTVMMSFKTTVRQMTEMSQRKNKNQSWRPEQVSFNQRAKGWHSASDRFDAKGGQKTWTRKSFFASVHYIFSISRLRFQSMSDLSTNKRHASRFSLHFLFPSKMCSWWRPLLCIRHWLALFTSLACVEKKSSDRHRFLSGYSPDLPAASTWFGGTVRHMVVELPLKHKSGEEINPVDALSNQCRYFCCF